MKSTMPVEERRDAVARLTLEGASVARICREVGICARTVGRDREALGLRTRRDLDAPMLHAEVERLTLAGLDAAEIAERLDYTTARIYQIQAVRGLRDKLAPSPAQIRGFAKRSASIRRAAERRNRRQVRCSHCGAPADPENRMRGADWCDACLITHAGDADPGYERLQREAALSGYSRQSAISEAELWAPGAYTGGGNLFRAVGKAARRIGAVRAPVRGAELSLDEQRASAERMRKACRAEKLANLAPFGRRDGREAGR